MKIMVICRKVVLTAMAVTAFASCSDVNMYEIAADMKRTLSFNVSVTGQKATRIQYSVSDMQGLDPMTGFGLVVADGEGLVVDNEEVLEIGGRRSANVALGNSVGTLSAYYPYTSSIDYHPETRSYNILFKTYDTAAGVMVSDSRILEDSSESLSSVDLEFHYITNEIGFRIAETTKDSLLQGHVRIRRIEASGVASEGVYSNPVDGGQGSWSNQNGRRSVVVFDGDCAVPVSDYMYVGSTTLSESESDCNTFVEVPEEIRQNIQYLTVTYDIEPFQSDGCICSGMRNLSQVMTLYGVLPDNSFAEGKKYIFNIGLDMNMVFRQIAISAQVDQWENNVCAGTVTYEK